jgi:uncharacterized protein YndB with AHSA1/START domain
VTLPTEEQILITREFDAPRHLVYRAWTTPELVRRWWSGRRGEMQVAEIDLRVGGMWRYVMTAEGGFEVAFHGEYREIVENERIVTTEVFEAMPGDGVLTSSRSARRTADDARAARRVRQPRDPRRHPRVRDGDRHAGADGPARGAGDRTA